MLAAGAASGSFTPVADELKVDRGFEAALGAALGDDLESPLDRTAPAYWTANGEGADDPTLPQGLSSLISHVSGPDALKRRLRQIGIVASVEEGQRLMPLLRPGQRLVTKEGALFRWDGHVASADAPGSAALRLAQKNRLAEIEGEIDEARFVLEEAQERLSVSTDAIRMAEAGLNEARERSRLAARQLTEARDALSMAERASGDLLRRRDVISEALNQIGGQIEEIAVQEENARIELEDSADLSSLDERLRDSQLEVATDRSLLAEARARHEGLSREADARQRRINAIAQERATWAARAASAADHIATLREREEEARDELAELDIAPEEFDEKRRNLLSELQKMEEARRAAADRLVEAENLQRDADRAAATALSELAEAREKRGRAEERLVSAREKRQESEHRIREALNVEPHMALRLTGLPPGAPLPEVRDVERDLDRLKIERERLGAVNLRADEEQAELSAQACRPHQGARRHYRCRQEAARWYSKSQPRGS